MKTYWKLMLAALIGALAVGGGWKYKTAQAAELAAHDQMMCCYAKHGRNHECRTSPRYNGLGVEAACLRVAKKDIEEMYPDGCSDSCWE
jgi:hypothetical protein